MKTIKDRLFIREVVRFDGHTFLARSFEECLIEYGGDPCEWHDCRFFKCRVILDDAAEDTVQVLKALGIQLIPPSNSGIEKLTTSALKN